MTKKHDASEGPSQVQKDFALAMANPPIAALFTAFGEVNENRDILFWSRVNRVIEIAEDIARGDQETLAGIAKEKRAIRAIKEGEMMLPSGMSDAPRGEHPAIAHLRRIVLPVVVAVREGRISLNAAP